MKRGLFEGESEFAAFVMFPCEMPGGRRDREQRRERGRFDGFAVGHEFEQSQPAVAAAAVETAADRLRVERHLRHLLAGGVLRHGK